MQMSPSLTERKGLIMVKGIVVANLNEDELVDRFVSEVEAMASKAE